MSYLKSIFAIFFLFNCTITIAQKSDEIFFYDENEKQVSQEVFEKLQNKRYSMVVKNDSLEKYRILPKDRTERGKIVNLEEIILKIETRIGTPIDRTKPIIIIYHPGQDPCNTSGSASHQSRRAWFKILEKKIFKISKTKPIYLYKKVDGLEKYNRIINWFKDPENIVEKTFFRFHYPCSSYVIISPDGTYISFFGEFSKEQLWSHLEALKQSKL